MDLNDDVPAKLAVLKDLFPTFPDEVLWAAFEAHGFQIDGAVESLLEMSMGAEHTDGGARASSTVKAATNPLQNAQHKGHQSSAPQGPLCPGKPSASAPATAPHLPQPIQQTSHQRDTFNSAAAGIPASTKLANPRAALPVAGGDSRGGAPPRKSWGQLRQGDRLHQQHPPGHTPAEHQRSRISQKSVSQPPESQSVTSYSQLQQSGPKYIAPGTAGPHLNLDAAGFPELAAAGGRALRPISSSSTAGLTTSSHSARNAAVAAVPGGKQQQQQQQLANPAYSYGYYGYYGYAHAARHVPAPHQAVQAGCDYWPHLLTASSAGADGGGGGSDGPGVAGAAAGWQEAALDELCQSHPWVGRDLLEAICQTLQYDLSDVVSAMDELQAASYQAAAPPPEGCRRDGRQPHPQAASGSGLGTTQLGSSADWFLSFAGSASSSSGEAEDVVVADGEGFAEDEKQGRTGREVLERRGFSGAGRRRDADEDHDGNGDLVDDDFAVHSGVPKRGAGGCFRSRLRGGSAGGTRKGRERGGGAGGGGEEGVFVGATAAAAADCHSGGDDSGLGSGDAYARHRRSALRLTHAWRKRMGKASAAFSSGDRALGRRLVAEAQALRVQAAEAHRQAATRIEEEMNGGRQLSEWDLDLHGLHADEAVAALTRRMAALECTPDTTSAAAAAGSRPPGRQPSATKAPLAGPSSSAGHVVHGVPAPVSSSAPTTATATAIAQQQQHLLASRRVLRVIVGRGLHSSGGEASLPRVVEGHLMQQGYRFSTPRAGVVEVQLRRRYSTTVATTTTTTTANAGSATTSNTASGAAAGSSSRAVIGSTARQHHHLR